MSHHHDHHHSASKNIGIAFFLNIVFVVIEIIGGFWTNSVAILADAIHDFGDSVGLAFARLAQKYSGKKPDALYTYGYKRYSLLAAFVLGTLLIIGSGVMIYNGIMRLLHPQSVYSLGIIVLSILGIIVNGAGVLQVHRGTTQNEKIISRHLLEDVLGRTAVLIGGILAYLTPRGAILDPLIAIVFSLFIAYNAIRNTYQTITLLTQGTPKTIAIDHIKTDILANQNIQDIHDIHCRSLDGEASVFSAHLVVYPDTDSHTIKKTIKALLEQKYHITHTTLEIEKTDEKCLGSCDIDGNC